MKAAIYIEQISKKNGEKLGWAGYIYADEEVDPRQFEYEKEGVDQWGKKVKVYRSTFVKYFESPGKTHKSDLVVLF